MGICGDRRHIHTSLPCTPSNLEIFIYTIPHLDDIFPLLDHYIRLCSICLTVCEAPYVTMLPISFPLLSLYFFLSVFFFFYMKGYDNTGRCGYIGGCKVVGAGHSDNIYWSEIRGKCVLVGLYGAGWDWFSLAVRRRQQQQQQHQQTQA